MANIGALYRRPWGEAALMALLPCLLLLDIHDVYDGDWNNNTWQMGYAGAYFLSHMSFPPVLNTPAVVGLAFPVFYAYGFYPVLGVFCTLLHPHVVILAAAWLLYAVQYGALALLLLRASLPRWFASVAAITVIFAVYPLSNLYNRSALPEFFASISLTASLITLVLSIACDDTKERRQWFAVTLALSAFMASTHAVTLVMGTLFLAILCPLLLLVYPQQQRTTILHMAVLALVILLIASPWAYATYPLRNKLAVNVAPKVVFYYDQLIDSVATRLWPLMYPLTPPEYYIDSGANMCLLGMALIVLILAIGQHGMSRSLLAFAGAMSAVGAFYLWSSLSYYPWQHIIPPMIHFIQMPYRLVTMINVSFLCLLMGSILWLKGQGKHIVLSSLAKQAAALLCMIAGVAFAEKMAHGYASAHRGSDGVFATQAYRQSLSNFPGGFYGYRDYATRSFFDPLQFSEPPMLLDMKGDIGLGTVNLNHTIIGYGLRRTPLCTYPFAPTYGVGDLYEVPPVSQVNKQGILEQIRFVLDEHSFGKVLPYKLHTDKEAWYWTSIYAFVWNKVKVDGQWVYPNIVDDHLAIYLQPGDHVVEYVFSPPPMWQILNAVALLTGGGVLFYAGFAIIRARRQ